MESDLAIRTVNEPGAYMIGTVFDAVCWEQVPRMNNMAPSNAEHEADVYQAGWATHSLKHLSLDRHNGGINSSFVDGSSRFVGIKELWLLKWNKNWVKCEPPNAWPSWTDRYKSYD
jgi:prepilin-type processing-associated H-X9-DG protein